MHHQYVTQNKGKACAVKQPRQPDAIAKQTFGELLLVKTMMETFNQGNHTPHQEMYNP